MFLILNRQPSPPPGPNWSQSTFLAFLWCKTITPEVFYPFVTAVWAPSVCSLFTRAKNTNGVDTDYAGTILLYHDIQTVLYACCKHCCMRKVVSTAPLILSHLLGQSSNKDGPLHATAHVNLRTVETEKSLRKKRK